MRHRALDLIIAAALAAGAMTLVRQAPDASLAHLFLALPLVLLLPGYALTAAAFPGAELSLAERTLLSLGLSLAATVLGGLALQWAPIGLAAPAWAALLGNLTLAACLVALVRRLRVAPPAPRPGVLLQRRQALMLGTAGLIACTALLVAREGALQRQAGAVTQLWLLPAHQAGALQLGVANLESRPANYRLELSGAGDVLASWPSIALDPGERWEQSVTLPPSQSGVEDVRAVLYRLDEPGAPYRQVVYRFEREPAGDARPVQTPAQPISLEAAR